MTTDVTALCFPPTVTFRAILSARIALSGISTAASCLSVALQSG